LRGQQIIYNGQTESASLKNVCSECGLGELLVMTLDSRVEDEFSVRKRKQLDQLLRRIAQNNAMEHAKHGNVAYLDWRGAKWNIRNASSRDTPISRNNRRLTRSNRTNTEGTAW
jgi:hypothetical protein